MRRVGSKWRPPLGLVVGGTLAGVFCLPLLGVGYFKLAGNLLNAAETTMLIFALALLCTAILGFLLWRLVLRPVYALTAHARAVRRGMRDAPVPDHFGTPEFRELGEAVGDMAATLHSRADSLQAYADHVTHELKSPLTAIAGAAELLQHDMPQNDRAQLAATVAEASARMERLLDDLRAHARAAQQADPAESVLGEAAQRVVQPGLAIDVRQDGTVPLPAADLLLVLTQLAQNAVAHGADAMTVQYDGTVLRISDNGRGIAEGNRSRVFDPFFTTRRDTGGTGMGLSIVRTLLLARGGRIALADTDGGAAFEIRF
ncbi:ATP-binding protein [Sulfitobacter sp. S190]|uniref:ATP-binding protein n=1 Tax=Sulfitobacter sp. S190 TaxID=2867022 RepID=UPI0021A5AFB4|nr:ATP-binding protein [Sulfitobacter sp. S190]UWR22190.1 HAMP domain-containing protein [Sulfitobacter sp. S190]